MQRRTYVTALAAGVAALAGCGRGDGGDSASGSADGGDGGDTAAGDASTDTPTDITTATDTSTATPTATQTETKDVTIVEHELVEGSAGLASVEGQFENTSGRELSYIEVSARLFDADDVRLGESFTNATDVPAGQTVAFDVITAVEYSKVDRYEVEASTGL